MSDLFVYKSPAGYLYCYFQRGVVSSIDIKLRGRASKGVLTPEQKQLCDEFDDYFSSKGGLFKQPASFSRGTPFQHQVWQMLLTIPFGETRSYQWLAEAVGRPAAARAVGRAVGKNPLALVVPCHRIVAADGSIGGYSCGITIKQWLLRHEKARVEERNRGNAEGK